MAQTGGGRLEAFGSPVQSDPASQPAGGWMEGGRWGEHAPPPPGRPPGLHTDGRGWKGFSQRPLRSDLSGEEPRCNLTVSCHPQVSVHVNEPPVSRRHPPVPRVRKEVLPACHWHAPPALSLSPLPIMLGHALFIPCSLSQSVWSRNQRLNICLRPMTAATEISQKQNVKPGGMLRYTLTG